MELLATFDVHSIKLEISAQTNFTPRLSIEHGPRSRPELIDNKQTAIDKAKYNNRLHTIYNGLTNKLIIHLQSVSTIHRNYLRSFIPRSHRPYVRATNLVDLFATLPLEAAVLDYTQRQLLMDTANNVLRNEIKSYLYASRQYK